MEKHIESPKKQAYQLLIFNNPLMFQISKK